MSEQIVFERHETWAEIRLNRPEKGNALTLEMVRRLGEVVDSLAGARELRVIFLRGSGRFFCTGGDIGTWGGLTIIAVINGHALGGGLEVALAADLRIALRSAKLGMPEVNLGMIPGWMGVQRLAETIGVARARHMSLLGLPITAEEAFDYGLVTAVAEDEDDLARQVEVWRAKLCANAPISMAALKGMFAGLHVDDGHHPASVAAHRAGTDDCREGVRAFLEKRSPVFVNR